MSLPPDGPQARAGLAEGRGRVANGREEQARGSARGRGRRRTPRRLSGDEIFRLCLTGWIIVMIGGAIGFASSWLVQEQYGARSEVLYSLREDQPTGFLREDRNLTTQVVLIDSRTVLAPVAAESGMSFDDLAEKVTASVAEGSEVIEIEVRDPSRATGLQLVEGVTQRYLAVANGAVEQNRAYLQRQLAAVEARLSEGDVAAGQRASLTARRADLLDRLDTLALEGAPASQLGASYTTAGPVTPRRDLAAAAGAVAALLIATVVVAGLAQRWRRR